MNGKKEIILTLIMITVFSLPTMATEHPTSVFNQCIPDGFPRLKYRDLIKNWFAFPVTEGKGMFSPVFLKFQYECRSGEPDLKQPLTFPCLLSFKFDFVPDNYSSRHPGFIFRRDPEALKIQPTEPEKISSYIKSWSATHCIAGKLIQTEAGYGGILKVFDREGICILTKEYPANLSYFRLMGEMVRSWMEFRNQTLSNGLYQELIRPMTRDMETVRWYGESFDVEWRSQAEWDIYERILERDPSFGEIQHWYANQKGWKTGENQMTEKGRALLDHPVISTLIEFDPDECPDSSIVKNYRKTVSHLLEISPEDPNVLSAYLVMNRGKLKNSELDKIQLIAEKSPCNYPLLSGLAYEFEKRRIYEKSIPLWISAIFSTYLPGDGNFDFAYNSLGFQYWTLGLLPESHACSFQALYTTDSDYEKAWACAYLGYVYRDSFNYKKAAEMFREKYRLQPKADYFLFLGYLSLYEGGFIETVKEWEENPITRPTPFVTPFLEARRAIAAGDTNKALQAIEGITFDPFTGDKDDQLEAEIIRADALLSAKDKRAKQHAIQAWYIAPRNRRTAFLVEQVFKKEKTELSHFGDVAQFLFPGQPYWDSLRQRVKNEKGTTETSSKVWDATQKLIKMKRDFKGREIDFWMQQPPFRIEYYALKLSQSNDQSHQSAALKLYYDYTMTMRKLSVFQKIHTRNFMIQLLKLTGSISNSEREKYLRELND